MATSLMFMRLMLDMILFHTGKVDFRHLAAFFRDIDCTVLILQRDADVEEITAFSEILGRQAYDYTDYNQDLSKMAHYSS